MPAGVSAFLAGIGLGLLEDTFEEHDIDDVKLEAENAKLRREVSTLRGGAETPPPDEKALFQKRLGENDADEPPLLLSNNAAQPDRDAQPESSIDVALGDTFTSSGSLRS